MGKLFNVRWIVVVAIGLATLSSLAGCGNGDDGPQTGPGAPDGATGNAAGGAAVEAGKQRNPKDLANEKKHFSSEPPPIQITSGDDTGYRVDEPTAVVARSKKENIAMIKKHFSRGVKKQSLVETDYRTSQTVGLFMPQRPGGTLITITDVHEEDGKIVVNVTELQVGEGCKTGGKKPRPFQIVETRKMKGDAVVSLKKQTDSPC